MNLAKFYWNLIGGWLNLKFGGDFGSHIFFCRFTAIPEYMVNPDIQWQLGSLIWIKSVIFPQYMLITNKTTDQQQNLTSKNGCLFHVFIYAG